MKNFVFLLYVIACFSAYHVDAQKQSTGKINIPKPEEIIHDIPLINPQGEPIHLEDLHGRVVLIHFWASWCGFCRYENPSLVELYHEYNKKGLEIISISFDDNRSNWIDAVQTDSLIWKWHGSELSGLHKSKIAELLPVNAIPYNILVDENGDVVGVGLPIDKLFKKMKWLFEDQVYMYPKHFTDSINFSHPTKYVLKKLDGQIITQSKGIFIDTKLLEPGEYILQYDGKSEPVTKENITETVSWDISTNQDIVLSKEAYFEVHSSMGRLIVEGYGTSIKLSSLHFEKGTFITLIINGKAQSILL